MSTRPVNNPSTNEDTDSSDAANPTQLTDAAAALGDASEAAAADLWDASAAAVLGADVLGVQASGTAGAYTFSVTLRSPDVDCRQFANWWEVVTSDGKLLYRRILTHSHTDVNGTTDPEQPGNTFTRSGGPIALEAAEQVIVRAHMNTGGYLGRAMRGSAGDGFTYAPDVDAAFAPELEGEPPQPRGCEF